MITFGKFEQTQYREFAESEISIDGKAIGFITSIKEYDRPAHAWRVDQYEVAFGTDAPAEFHADDGIAGANEFHVGDGSANVALRRAREYVLGLSERIDPAAMGAS